MKCGEIELATFMREVCLVSVWITSAEDNCAGRPVPDNRHYEEAVAPRHAVTGRISQMRCISKSDYMGPQLPGADFTHGGDRQIELVRQVFQGHILGLPLGADLPHQGLGQFGVGIPLAARGIV